MPECGLSVDGHGAVVSSFLCKRYFQKLVFPAWSADGRPEIPLLVIPPEPPVAEIHRPTTARRGSRARLGLARRSAPLTPSTVVVGHHLATGGPAGITRTSCILLVSSEPQGKKGDSKGGRNRRLRPPLACPAGLAPRCSTVTFKLRSTAVGSRYPFSPHRLEVIQSLPPVLNRLPFCDHIPQAHMQRLHRIGRVDHPPHLRRKLEKWNHSLPVLPPQPSNRWVFLAPLGDELVQLLFGTLFGARPVDRLQVRRYRPALFPAHVIQAGPYHMHDAQLDSSLWIDALDCLRKSFQSVHTDNQDILHSTVLEFRQHSEPEFGAFVAARPQTQDVFLPFQVHPNGHIHGPIVHPAFMPHFHVQRIQIHDPVERVQRPALPALHLLRYPVGHFRYQGRTDLDPVDLLQMALDIASRHASRIHR